MIPHSTITEIADAGHMLPSEHPDAVNLPLARFLTS